MNRALLPLLLWALNSPAAPQRVEDFSKILFAHNSHPDVLGTAAPVRAGRTDRGGQAGPHSGGDAAVSALGKRLVSGYGPQGCARAGARYRHLHPADLVPLRDGAILLTAREAAEHVARDGDMIVLRSEDGGRKWNKDIPNLYSFRMAAC